jgi:hypothetical protein
MPLTIGTMRALLTAKPAVTSANAAIVSSASATNLLAGSLTVTVSVPTSVAAGNLLLAVATSGPETWTPPTGWTLYGTKAASGNSPQISIFTKTATASEVTPYVFTSNNGLSDALVVAIYNLSGTPTPSINGAITFSAYTSTAAVTIGGGSAIPSVLNCLPLAIHTIQQINLSTAGNPTGLTAGWTGQLGVWNIDAGNPGNSSNGNGYNAQYVASGPITVNTSSAISAGWTWGGAFSTFTGTSLMLFIAP